MSTATIIFSYDIVVRRTMIIEAKNEEINELLSNDKSSFLQMPQKIINLVSEENASYSDIVKSFPTNISVSAIHDDPEDIIIDK